jgi:Predicted enzyme related to lactoylglutathione lyase
MDLAATNVESAKLFYGELFGWTSREQAANGGSFIRLQSSSHDIGSVYQLRKELLDKGIASHWTPYILVKSVKDAVSRDPFVVSGVARIALILDSVGAVVGLWEPIELNIKANGHG